MIAMILVIRLIVVGIIFFSNSVMCVDAQQKQANQGQAIPTTAGKQATGTKPARQVINTAVPMLQTDIVGVRNQSKAISKIHDLKTQIARLSTLLNTYAARNVIPPASIQNDIAKLIDEVYQKVMQHVSKAGAGEDANLLSNMMKLCGICVYGTTGKGSPLLATTQKDYIKKVCLKKIDALVQNKKKNAERQLLGVESESQQKSAVKSGEKNPSGARKAPGK